MGDSITNFPSPKEEYDDFLKKCSNEERIILENLKEECKKFKVPSKKEVIIEEIDKNKRHDNLVNLCAQHFAQPDSIKKTGYQFYFAEPLIEFQNDGDSNKSFDLFLYNQKSHASIFIECKSSITKGLEPLTDVNKAKNLVEEKTEYLEQIIGEPIDKDKIEFVLCIYDKDTEKVFNAVEKHNVNNVNIWAYKPHSKIIQLHPKQHHKDQGLTDFLSDGFGYADLKFKYELPFLYTSHKYRLFILAIVGHCYRENLFGRSSSNPKIILKKHIIQVLKDKISLGVSQAKLNEIIEQLADDIIKHGLNYGLCEKNDENTILLSCRGNKIESVIKNIESKYFDKWALFKAEKECKNDAIKTYKEKALVLLNQTTIDDFPSQ